MDPIVLPEIPNKVSVVVKKLKTGEFVLPVLPNNNDNSGCLVFYDNTVMIVSGEPQTPGLASVGNRVKGGINSEY